MEAKNKDGEVFGFDRLKELFYRLIYLEPEEITNRIITQVRRFSGTNRSEDDDMTIIVIKYVETHPLDTVLSKRLIYMLVITINYLAIINWLFL